MKREILTGLAIVAGANLMSDSQREAASSGPAYVSVAGLPDTLPQPVSDEQDDIARVSTFDMQADSPGVEGSAVRVGNSLYLSAGHVISVYNGQLNPITKYCGSIEVQTASKNYAVRPIGYPAYQTSGLEFSAEKETGSYNNYNLRVADASLLEVNHESHQLPYKPISLAKPGSVHIGEDLYAENFEPTADGEIRTPYQEDLPGGKQTELLDKPAILGEVVIAYYEGLIVVLDGIKGYGPAKDKFGRPGESGGAEFTKDGQLVGISVRGPVNNSMPASIVEGDFNVDIEGISPKTAVSYTFIQPITRRLINQMKAKLKTAPDCLGKGQVGGK